MIGQYLLSGEALEVCQQRRERAGWPSEPEVEITDFWRRALKAEEMGVVEELGGWDRR